MEREGIGLSRRLDPKERRDSPSTSKRAFNVAGNESRRLKFRRERERERGGRGLIRRRTVFRGYPERARLK